MKRSVPFLILTAIILSTFIYAGSLYAGTDYYVDSQNGSDSNNGRSTSSAWKTIDKVNHFAFAPGDRILFKKGEVWREELAVTSSGTSSAPITYAAYGSGSKPKLLGSVAKNSTSDWNRESGNIWYTHHNQTVYQCVFKNEDAYSRRVTKKGNLDKQGELYWDSSNSRVYLYSSSNPASYYNGSVELCKLASVIKTSSKNHLKFEDLDVRYTSGSAFHISSSDNVVINGCTMKYCGETYSADDPVGQWSGAGVYGYNADKLTVKNCRMSYVWMGVYHQGTGSNSYTVIIDNNIISYCIIGGNTPLECHGVAFGGGQSSYYDYSGSKVSNNHISYFGNRGVSLSHALNMKVEYNTIHNNYGSGTNHYDWGIGMGAGGSGQIIRYNHIYNITGNPSQWNDGVGIYTRGAKNSYIYYNIIHDCVKGIYNSVKSSSGSNNNNKIYNNVCYDCSKYGIWINNGISSGNKTKITVMNNICDGSSADLRLADYVDATGGYNCLMNDSAVSKAGTSSYSGANTDFYSSNPKFTNAAGNNFSLRSDSPCIDKGTDVGLNRDYAGNPVPKGSSVDMGALEYQSGGGGGDDDPPDPDPDPDPPTASAGASPKSGTAPLTVSFTGSASNGDSPYSYSWNFGDGSTSTAKNPSHTYNNSGTFTATLTVTDSAGQKDTDTETINVSSGSSSQVTLSISSSTGAPASGASGTINPSIGSHSYAKNERVQVKATPKSNYRFGKWTGDVNSSSVGYSTITLTMGGNKSIEAIFCSRCGDVNGDLQITPTDAQYIFDIFLGKLKNPTFCQKENADVNCDGTRSNPNVTPFDAQAIFDFYLGKNNLPSDCSCNSRSSSTGFTITTMTVSEFNLILDPPQYGGDNEIFIPVRIDMPIPCDSFGFDLFYDSDLFEFVGTGRTELTENFLQVEGNIAAPGILRVGGYRENSLTSMLPGELVIMIFKAKTDTGALPVLKIFKTYDSLEKAAIN